MKLVLLLICIIIPSLLAVNIFQYLITSSSSFAQQSSTTINSESTESVTSTYDAIIKSVLIISQVSILGMVFNHLFFTIISNRKEKGSPSIYNEGKNHIFYINKPLFKRFTFIMIICCISIIIASTGSIFLQSYQLSQNLSMDLFSAFSIAYSTSIGKVFLIRIVTAVVIVGLIISYNIIKRRIKIKKEKNTISKSTEDSNDQIQENNDGRSKSRNITDLAVLIGIIAISSVNLFSNSMISHSNTESSLSILGISIDWIHFNAVSIWIGGLFYLSIIILKSIKLSIDDTLLNNINNKDVLKEKLRNLYNHSILLMYFSYIAIVSLTVIGVSGLYLSLTHLQHLIAIFTTLYGQTLIIKLGLAFPMIFLGRFHQRKIQNHMALITNTINSNYNQQSNNTFLSHSKKIVTISNTINKSIKVESIIGISVLITAAFLSVTSPPSEISTNQNPIFNESNINLIDITVSMNFMALVISLSIIIIILGIVNFRKNQSQIKDVPTIQ